MSRDNITNIVIIACAVLLTLKIESCFHRNRPDSYFKEKLADKETEIKEIRTDRDIIRGKYDSLIALDRRKDTVLIRDFRTNTIKYEKIPVDIRNLNNEDLRRAIYGY